MFDFIKQLLSSSSGNFFSGNNSEEKKLQIATCALFIEIASADFNFSIDERNEILSVMKTTFDLSDEQSEELVRLAEEKVKNSVSIYEFTQLIDQNFSRDEKFEILKNLWRLVYLDNTLDQYEDHLMKRIGNNLKFEHREIMAAKLLVKEELKL
ncbi:MAG: TerB family tellurite resistance protein [Bacteroidota bacterium]|nr:TerB family tellurite resistance protein [Bacteroidota bacterium]MDP4191188.1 TerB family tellurite resistance protein [Bacteroidota bacterium]MDP4194012.1 TerB family tellurite resistance protein [Bacteroidota bacterium]